MTTPKIDVLVCTHGDRLCNIDPAQLPQTAGVRYVITSQSAEKSCAFASQRPDIEVHFNNTRGLSANRNAAFANARAPYVLIADDDVQYSAAGLATLAQYIERQNLENGPADIILNRVAGVTHRRYPATGHLSAKANHYAASVEIALRLQFVRENSLLFDTRFGLGATVFGSGEEDVFLYQAMRKTTRTFFSGITIGRHPQTTTGQDFPTPATLMARGAVLRLRHPRTAPARIARLAFILSGNALQNAFYMYKGYHASPLAHPGNNITLK